MIAELNLAIATSIWVLALFVSIDQWLDRDAHARWRFVALVVLVLASINIVTAAPTPLDLTDNIEAFRFVTAALRSVALVLLLAYAGYRWEER